MKKFFISIVFLLISVLLIFSLTSMIFNSSKNINKKWVTTWGTSPQLVEPHNMPPEPGLANNTLRQIVRVSIGGEIIRLKFSNEFSDENLELKSVKIAISSGNGAIEKKTLKDVKFEGKKGVIIEPGKFVVSDPVKFVFKPRTDIAITIFFGSVPAKLTGHPGSRTTSYILKGNMVDDVYFKESIKTDHWYVINSIDVLAPENSFAVVTLGNSITDGRGSGTNKQNRWPDILSEKLLQNEKTKNVAVVNMGIGGNCVLKNCLGPSAINRFDRDVLQHSSVKWLIILEGINDIGQTKDSIEADEVAEKLIEAYTIMIEKAHKNNIKVYGATILPFGKSHYYTEYREKARQKDNYWIRNSNKFDAIIDFDNIMKNPENPLELLPDAHTGDYLHPNEKGYKIMGESIDLKLFEN